MPGYIVREEMKREKMRVEAGKRAVKYEDKMNEKKDCKLLIECWKDKDVEEDRDKESGSEKN